MLIWSSAAYCLQLRCRHVNGFQRGNWDVLERNTSGPFFKNEEELDTLSTSYLSLAWFRCQITEAPPTYLRYCYL